MRSPFDLGAKQMKDISLRILDMECAACVARLDRALEKLPGVQRAVFGVKDVAVQADGMLTAYLWPIGVDGRDLAAACADAGCAVTLGERRGCDIGRTTYAKYEAGELNVRVRVLLALKRLYGCPYDAFFAGLDTADDAEAR